jgi:hypothetical protein
MPSAEESKKAGYHDVADWGEKDLSGCYAPGTSMDLGEHGKLDPSKVPDHIGGKAPKRSKRAGSK